MRIIVRVKVEGKENLPTSGPVILAANHRSFIDSLFIPLVVMVTHLFLVTHSKGRV